MSVFRIQWRTQETMMQRRGQLRGKDVCLMFSHFWLQVCVCVVILAQMQYSSLSQCKCVFDLVIIKSCIRGVCVHRWHGLDFLQNIPGQPDEQMNHVASPQTADPQLQRVLYMWYKHLDPSLLTKCDSCCFLSILGLLTLWTFLCSHISQCISQRRLGSHCAGVQVVSLIFTQWMCNMHKNIDAQCAVE